VVTDDLEMGAIIRHAAVAQAAIQALVAGADLLLICHSIDHALAARDACLRALEAGDLSEQRLEEARRRLVLLKRRHTQQRRAARAAIGSQAHQQLVEVIVRQASEKA
jgi:beta-N-acetylhexosaminidase